MGLDFSLRDYTFQFDTRHFNGFPIVQPSRNAAEVIAQVRGSDGVHDILIDHRTSTLQEILWVHDFSLPD